jgi:hypothetical protein
MRAPPPAPEHAPAEAGQGAGAELLEDEQRFIDLSRSPLWFGEENVMIG